MKYSDSNIHLPLASLVTCENMLRQELHLPGVQLASNFNEAVDEVKGDLVLGNVMLFNQNLKPDDIACLATSISSYRDYAYRLTFLSSPSSIKSKSCLASYKDAGVSGIKFHSYLQNISSERFGEFLKLARYAEDLRMPIWVDASFGTIDLYKYDNLKLIVEIARSVKKVPIVILHSGGCRALEALLIAESCQNIFLDMSFSVPYYLGSTVEKDLVFAYKKIGPQRVVYGSDYPYILHRDAMDAALRFVNENGFSQSDQEWIFRDSLQRIFDWH